MGTHVLQLESDSIMDILITDQRGNGEDNLTADTLLSLKIQNQCFNMQFARIEPTIYKSHKLCNKCRLYRDLCVCMYACMHV